MRLRRETEGRRGSRSRSTGRREGTEGAGNRQAVRREIRGEELGAGCRAWRGTGGDASGQPSDCANPGAIRRGQGEGWRDPRTATHGRAVGIPERAGEER